MFPKTHKLKKFMTTKISLQKILNRILYSQGEEREPPLWEQRKLYSSWKEQSIPKKETATSNTEYKQNPQTNIEKGKKYQ